MFGAEQKVRTYLSKLGLPKDITDLYLALLAYGPQTFSELSRHSGVERTRVYRLLDEMTAHHLIEVQSRYRRSIILAAPIDNLEILLTKKEQELRDLQKDLQDLQEALRHNSLQLPATRIQAYHGLDGLKQMFWNQTRSKSPEMLSILYENMQSRTNLAFFERWVESLERKSATSRSVISENFLRTQQEWYRTHDNKRLSRWEGRYVPDKLFTITHSTIIYDDVTSYYNWKDGEVFGIEIHNQEITDAQRQFFEMLWNLGIKVDKLTFESPDV